jgi:secreted trypsin-like serine protease
MSRIAMRAVAAAAALLCSAEGARLAKRASASCGVRGASRDANIQIVNGQVAEECEWKWQVGLWSSGSKPFCGGMLIAEDWVLTAAHCMVYSNFTLVAGDLKPSDTGGNEQRRWAKKIVKHPRYDYDWQGSWDFALVQLDSPMNLNSCVGTVCLPRSGDVAPGTKCWISGWGTLRSGGGQPDVLMEASVDTISTADCGSKYRYRSWQITESMLCAQGRNAKGRVTDGCQGDSGGPLVCESGGSWTLYGATSWGYGCADPDYPGVWARVHEALDWIDETMA